MHTRELPCFCKSVNRWVLSRSSNLRRLIHTFDPTIISLLRCFTLLWTMLCWGLLGSVIGTTLILSGLFFVTWGQSVERKLKALSVGPTIPIFRALETPLLRYSGSSVLSVLNPLNCMETNSKRSWCKMGGFLTLGFWGCLISSANCGGYKTHLVELYLLWEQGSYVLMYERSLPIVSLERLQTSHSPFQLMS